MTTLTTREDGYPLGHSDHETRRLTRQHHLYGPLTRHLLQQAGISRGMRVLDLGTGAGDVALLAAEMVGPQGSVTGVDSNAAIVETAASRIAAAGWDNTRVMTGQLDEVLDLDLDGPFDAVIGRWILVYLDDPAGVLRRVATMLRPGGILAFQESDLTVPMRSHPSLPLHGRLAELSRPSADLALAGEMGPTLWRTFLRAGLPGPVLVMETPIGAGPGFGGYQYIEDSLRSLEAAFTSVGIVFDDVGGLDGLADRLRDEVVSADAVEMLASVVGAWTRVP